jgi:hypothetical protein
VQPTDPLLSLTLGVTVLRAGPATDWGAVAELPANTEVELIGCFGSGCLSHWLLVRSGETTGWLRTDDIQPVPELDALPTVGRTAKLLPFEMITLLADPRAGATVVATITAADAITVLGRSEAAGRVAILAGRIGWIPASRLDGDVVLLPLYTGSGTAVFNLRAGLL